MLHTHRTDLRIIRAAQRRRGATVGEITEVLAGDGDGPVSSTTVKRHLSGLRALGAITGRLETRDGRRVAVWTAKNQTTTTC